ncbi:MAG: hypothetical protein ACRDA4_00745 [Filifactoraceae bacterium]
MNNSKVLKFLLGLVVDIGISLIIGLGPALTVLFALVYVLFSISDIKMFLQEYRSI